MKETIHKEKQQKKTNASKFIAHRIDLGFFLSLYHYCNYF